MIARTIRRLRDRVGSRAQVFRGDTLKEAVAAVRLACGPDAAIISTRSRRKHALFGPRIVEVAVCPQPGGETAETVAQPRERRKPRALGSPPRLPAPPPRRPSPERRPSPASQEDARPDPARRAGPAARATTCADGGVRGSLEEILLTAGVAPELAIVLATNALAGGRSPLVSTTQLGARLGDAVGELLGRPRPVDVWPGDRRTVAFIGPHGGGKTTALVKVACRLCLERGCTAALVTADTHRLAAAEQLARYAAVLGLDFAVAYTPGELRRQCAARSAADVILVDTPGHVWRAAGDLSELGAALEAVSPDEVHLVLPATRDLTSAEHAMYAYRPLGVDRLLVSKLDEAESYAPVLNLAASTKLPLSYLGCGPDVPGLLEPPDAQAIARALLAGDPPSAIWRYPDEPAKEAGVVG